MPHFEENKETYYWGTCICATISCVLTVILIIVLLALSVKTVEQDEIAIRYDSVSRKIYDEILGEGKFLLTPASKLFKYPRTVQTSEFNIECLSNEGLDMNLLVTVQYQINQTELLDILRDYGMQDEYVLFIESITRDDLKDSCSQFSGQDFFSNRNEIESEMSDSLDLLYNSSNSHTIFRLLQLNNVQHPNAFALANERLQLAEQESTQLVNIRAQELILAETRLNNAEIEANRVLILAQGVSSGLLVEAEQTAIAINEFWTQRTNAIWTIANQTGLSIDDLIGSVLKYDTIIQIPQPTINFRSSIFDDQV